LVNYIDRSNATVLIVDYSISIQWFAGDTAANLARNSPLGIFR